MAKHTKTTKEDIYKRRRILKDLVRRVYFYEFEDLLRALNEELNIEKLNKIEESTLRRDMKELNIIKSPINDYYVDPQFLAEETDKNSILQSIKPYVKGNVISNMQFLVLEVIEDTSELIGKKIMQLYGDIFLDYIPAHKTLLLLVRSDKADKAEKLEKAEKILNNILHNKTPLYY